VKIKKREVVVGWMTFLGRFIVFRVLQGLAGAVYFGNASPVPPIPKQGKWLSKVVTGGRPQPCGSITFDIGAMLQMKTTPVPERLCPALDLSVSLA